MAIQSTAAPHEVDAQPETSSDNKIAGTQIALTATLLGAALSGCGGGGAELPAALLDSRNAVYQPTLLPRATSSASITSRAARIPTPSEVFDWAERQFPSIFSSHESNQSSNGLVYRYYPGTGHYLAVSGDSVLALGPLTQGSVVNVGTLQSFAEAVAASAGAKPNSDVEAARFLLQAQFSASEAEIAAVRTKGYEGWLTEQLALPNSQSGWDWLVSKGYSVIDTNEFFSANGMYKHMIWNQLIQSPDAVRRRWAWALSTIFVVSWRGIKDVMNWDSFGMAEYWDILCRRGYGNYRALLEELTLNPAMGAFLSTRGNAKEDAATGRLPDENYAREVLQLFSIGLHDLNLDGTVKRNGAGQPIESYSADDVSNLARVFTGYNQDLSAGFFTSPKPPNLRWAHLPSARNRMVFDANLHSPLEKRFLGITIPPNTSGPESLRIDLDTLANHPNTAPFLSRQLIQRMVTSNPSPAYVQRVAQVFNNNGSGTRGDLQAVLKAILLDDEARNSNNLNSPTFGKLREPVLRVAQWGRTFQLTSLRGTWKMRVGEYSPQDSLSQMPLDPPSVFSYFRPGYVPPGTAMAATGATAPEFQLVNESSVASWTNLLINILQRGIYVSAPEIPGFPAGPTPTDGFDIVPNYVGEKAMVTNPQALVDRFNLLMCAGQLAPSTVQLIVQALKADDIRENSTDEFKQIHVARALLFVMSAADYLVQR